MKRTDGPGTAPGGLFTLGVPNVTPATTVMDDWLNNVQEELCSFIEGQGITLDGSDMTQFAQALASYVTASLPATILHSVKTIFTSSGTWTKATLNPKFVIVTCIGGGGGSGGIAASGLNEFSGTAGAGGGGFSQKTIQAASLGATEAVVVGTGGAAAAAGNNDGVDGTDSSFGSHCSAAGGARSTGSPTQTITTQFFKNGGGGGIGTGGDLNIDGQTGYGFTGFSRYIANLPNGGDSMLGYGGRAVVNLNGLIGVGYGAGGSGSTSNADASTVARTGCAGTNGIVIVEEFY